MMHRVKMLETVYMADNSIYGRHYLKGRQYSVSDYLCSQMIAMGVVSFPENTAKKLAYEQAIRDNIEIKKT